MDMRTGELYRSRKAAIAAGVPEAELVEVQHVRPFPRDVVRIVKGPFKGRIYERRAAGQLLRRRDLECHE